MNTSTQPWPADGASPQPDGGRHGLPLSAVDSTRHSVRPGRVVPVIGGERNVSERAYELVELVAPLSGADWWNTPAAAGVPA